MTNVVIAGYARSPFHLANKGALARVRPDDLAAQTIREGLAKGAPKRRQGLGRELVELVERQIREAEARDIFLRASLNAVPFYERLGFKAQEREEMPLGGSGVRAPVVIMRKALFSPRRRKTASIRSTPRCSARRLATSSSAAAGSCRRSSNSWKRRSTSHNAC